ncbi:MAG TPA: hypothetical protein VHI52_06065 [Verrucomicrobiae bacterium]|nr:hypothetical protein [Verrucomicrobiae bacterium]
MPVSDSDPLPKTLHPKPQADFASATGGSAVPKSPKPALSWSFGAAIGLCFLITGCVNQRITWSPDGEHAAIFAGDGLHLCGPDGTLSGLLMPGDGIAQWFPDSHRLVVVSEVGGQSWNELEKLLPPAERKRAEEAARVLLDELKAGHSVSDGLKALSRFNEYEGKAAVAYLSQSESARDLPQAARGALPSNEAQVIRMRLGTIENGNLVWGTTVVNTLRKILDVRISPMGTALGFAAETDKEDLLDLLVVPVDGSAPPQLVARNAAVCSDWSNDGRSLVYIRAVNGQPEGDQLSLGSLSRRTVLNAAGKIELNAKTEDLAGLLFESINKVRCLAGGRILFAAGEVHLPCTALDMPQQPQLYVLDPERQMAVIPLIPRSVRESLPAKASFYEASPDGKRIAIVGDKGEVAVFTPATGELENMQGSGGKDTVSAPAWRSPDELCFISSKEGEPQQVALWKDGKTAVLSTNWPAAARKGFLDDK